ncbi:outer membrane lipoprotein [Salmonella enterica subsp. arizonae]|nr:outer membrane lipoprotein [Salmonella enterica subsp. arizonae]
MQKRLMTALFTAATLFTVAGCSSNQAVKTTDGKTIVTDGNPRSITIPVWCLTKTPPPGKPSRLTAIS